MPSINMKLEMVTIIACEVDTEVFTSDKMQVRASLCFALCETIQMRRRKVQRSPRLRLGTRVESRRAPPSCQTRAVSWPMTSNAGFLSMGARDLHRAHESVDWRCWGREGGGGREVFRRHKKDNLFHKTEKRNCLTTFFLFSFFVGDAQLER